MACKFPHCHDGMLTFAELRNKGGVLIRTEPLPREAASAEEITPPDRDAGEYVTTAADVCLECNPEYLTPEARDARDREKELDRQQRADARRQQRRREALPPKRWWDSE